MKKNKIFNLTLLFALVLLATTSCSDMLTPDLERYSEKNGKDSIYSYLGILKSMQKIADRTVILGEARGDLVYSTKYLSDSVSQLYNFDEVRDGDNAFLQCADYYNVINQCNFYLHYVDTADVKDEVKYMQKEWAQVQAVRAWTYMQLVQNYGEVPFFTEPVSNSSLGREIAKSGTKANRKNLVDLLMNAGLERAYELQEQYGVPYYGRYSNGSVNIDSRICFFPVGLVMADLYLLADNYSKAAESYYDYIRLDASQADVSTAGFMESVQQEGNRYITHGISGWAGRLRSYSRSTNSEIITLIPSAASKNNGEVLTSVQNVYGFKTSVSSGGGVSGSINIQPLEEYRQLMPSNYYLGLSDQQLYCHYSENGGVDVQEYYDGVGDARVWGTAPFCRIDGENFRFIAKRTPVSGTFYDWSTRLTYASGYNSYYGIPVYRKSQVYLRFAEALNRAGFPQHAFAILKDGLNSENFPTINYKDSIHYNIVNDSDTVSIDTIKDVPYLKEPTATPGGAYYITLAEMLKAQTVPFLDFQDSHFNNSISYGIHSFGSGDTRGYHDTLYSYNICVAQKIAQAWQDAGKITTDEEKQQLTDSLNKVGIENAVAAGTITEAEVTDAVEDLIMDEDALETAYEGYRYYDLLRFASHKGNGTIDNEWLAKKIASRGYAPGKGYDTSLYSRIVGGTRWFLPLPEDQ